MPLLRYTATVNGFDSLIVTKLDVLDEFDEIQVCVGYRIGGKEMCEMPPTVAEIEQVEPVYEVLPGWQFEHVRYVALRRAAARAKDYLAFLEERTGRGGGLHLDRAGAQPDDRAGRVAF